MDGKAGTSAMVRQMTELLDKLQGEEYSSRIPVLNGATLGQHFRHIIDFYQSLLRDISTGTIDYSHRDRDVRLEEEITAAKSALESISCGVESLDEHRLLGVRTDFSDHPGADRQEVSSSVGRELMYAYDHALHHLAIIRIGVKALRPGLALDEKLGVAPSTLKYQQEKKDY